MSSRNPIVLALALAFAPCAVAQDRLPLTLLRTDGAGALYQCGDQRVLVLKGRAREMGRQHGALLADEVRLVTDAVLQWTARMGVDEPALQRIADAGEPHVPARCREELEGLAAGSGVPLARLRLAHAMPERFHCSGAAAAGSATADGQLYHTRSLDYTLEIGEQSRIQSHALLIVRNEEGAVPSAIPAWAGFLGAVTGINDAGITVGEMGCDSKDESFDGVPMIFQLREVLATCTTLEQAVERFRRGPRTCGYSFIVGSGDEKKAVAIEVTRSHVFTSGMDDPAEDVAPHRRLRDAVRRSNHFVGERTAATQRDVYDPRSSRPSSWRLYEAIGEFLTRNHGKLDARLLVELLRLYPPAHGCLHQAVMEGGARAIWIAQAGDDRKLPFAGAQNMDFQRYELRALIAGGEAGGGERPAPATLGTAQVLRAPARDAAELPVIALPRGPGKTCEVGTAASQPLPIEFRGELLQTTREFRVERWRAPDSEGYPAVELYLPAARDERAAPLILAGSGDPRLRLDRVLCSTLAQRGVPVLLVPIFERRAQDALAACRFLMFSHLACGLLERTGASGAPAFAGLALGGRVALDAAECDGQEHQREPKVVVLFGGMDLGTTAEERQRWLRFTGADERAFDAWLARMRAIQDGLGWLRGCQRTLFLGLRGEKALPVEKQEALVALLKNPTVHWLEGGVGRLPLHAAELATRIVEFVRQ